MEYAKEQSKLFSYHGVILWTCELTFVFLPVENDLGAFRHFH